MVKQAGQLEELTPQALPLPLHKMLLLHETGDIKELHGAGQGPDGGHVQLPNLEPFLHLWQQILSIGKYLH